MGTAPISLLLCAALLSMRWSSAINRTGGPLCTEYQKDFGSSCYEFVSLQRNFHSAQDWCERGGGHLAFILNDNTQQFLQSHLRPEQDWWLGLAPAGQNLSLDITAAEGQLSWLDGSDVSYANWFEGPPPDAGCGYILRDSGFRWEATGNCSQEFCFICEFESGHSLACAKHNATLQCGSGQVIEVDDGFYGRKSLHYCRMDTPPAFTPVPVSSSPLEDCSWVDVGELVAGRCHGLQVCQAAADVALFGEPCPGLGSYLSVDYHCKDGLHLLMKEFASVFDNVTITVSWLLNPFQGNLTCSLSSGDGHAIDPYSPEESESSIVHRYSQAGVFVVSVECTTSEWHVTAEKAITIQEPISEFGVIRCYSSNQSWDSKNCQALYGQVLNIQVELEAGTNVTYRIQQGAPVLAAATATRGIVPHNITVGPQVQQQLGVGCHQVALSASNRVKEGNVSVPLRVCLLEPVEGLKASLEPQKHPCTSSHLRVSVSLARGAPVQVRFQLSSSKDSFSEARDMLNGTLQVFSITPRIKGPMNVKVTATNSLSSIDLDLGNTTVVCDNHEPGDRVRVPRAGSGNYLTVTSDPENVNTDTNTVQLSIYGNSGINNAIYNWTCSGDCPCNFTNNTDQLQISKNCLPNLFNYSIYTLTATDPSKNNNNVKTGSKCIVLLPANDINLQIKCTEGCQSANVTKGINLTLICENCSTIQWFYEDSSNAPTSVKSCMNNNYLLMTLYQTGGNSILFQDNRNPPIATKVIAVGSSSSGKYGWYTYDIHQDDRSTTTAATSPHTTSPHTTSPHTTSPHTTSPHTTSPHTTSPHTTSPHTTSPHTTSPHTTSPHTTSPHTTSPHTTSPHTTSPHTTSPVTTSPHTTSPHTTKPSKTTTRKSTTTTTRHPSQSTSSPPPALPSLNCNISPTQGTILTAFTISCTTSKPFCSSGTCSCCLMTANSEDPSCGRIPSVSCLVPGERSCCRQQRNHHQLSCSSDLGMKSILLPLGDEANSYSLVLKASCRNNQNENIDTTLTAQVRNTSMQDLQTMLNQQQQISISALAQMCQAVSGNLNAILETAASSKMRTAMMTTLSTAMQDVSSWSAEDMQAVADTVAALSEEGADLTPDTQVQAIGMLEDLSQVLLTLNSPGNNDASLTILTASSVTMAASNILKVSQNSNQKSAISSVLLHTMDNVQTSMLSGMEANAEPAVVTSPQINIYVNRMTPDQLHGKNVSIDNSTAATFSLPVMDSHVLHGTHQVDMRMLSFGMNPFSSGEGTPVSGTVAGLSLTNQNGSTIPVGNLSTEIQIFLPRTNATQVNRTFLDLGNFSTVAISVNQPNVSLVLKLEPSEDMAFLLLLGFQSYPNQTHYLAQTQLPNQGSTQEEQYTWIIGHEDIYGKVGVFNLVVTPILAAGVNSTNATVYVTSISSQCVYWDEANSTWSNYGCRVGALTSPLVTQCLCTHLTFFGSSFFVMPNTVDVSQTAQLFATFVNNPVVVCFVGAIFLVYLIVLVWARRKDNTDSGKLRFTVLEDNDPLDQYRYMLHVSTGHRYKASTSSQVTVTLMGSEGDSEPHHLSDPNKRLFERGGVDMFLLTTPFSLGELHSMRLWHDNSGSCPAWYVNKVFVQDLETGQKWHFLCNSWLAIDIGECVLDKTFPVASESDLKAFSNVFFTRTANDFGDKHIWYSILYRPPASTFTRVQRVSCCFSLLLCTMLTNIMFWGVPKDPSEQTMDVGNIEFTWQEVMIGIESTLIMIPINVLIVTIFRNVRPREKKTIQYSSRVRSDKQGKMGRVSPNQQSSPENFHREITPDAVVKDIKRIAQSLSKTLKSPVPQLEMDVQRTADINTLLSLVEEIIRNQNRAGSEFFSESAKKDSSLTLTLENSPSSSPEKSVYEAQKQRDYRQCLYWQLQHVEKELEALGPSRFTSPSRYGQAVQQVQGMKGLLEAHLTPARPAEGQDVEGPSPPKQSDGCHCCHGGLPWWFLYVGWFLLVATSGVSAYFTMLYGLTYGKQRSISWLISMLVSFFHDTFVSEPLKVVGLAIFFALVLKKVEHDEYEAVHIENTGLSSDPDLLLTTRRNSTCSYYRPPPATNIERMKANMIKEQKVVALLREIMLYIGFMWMLLLVAYSYRDPNAYFLTQHIQQSFSSGVSNTMGYNDVFTWASTTLLGSLFGEYPGFITDGNSKLVGNARIRQVRVKRESCPITRYLSRSVLDCHASYAWDVEDMGTYGQGWSQVADTNSTLAPSAWQYQSQNELRSHPIWGNIALYRGGGFVATLGPDLENATSVLQYLFEHTWLDVYTRAVFVEFTVYNANVNLFAVVTFILENIAIGTFQFRTDLKTIRLYQSNDGLTTFVMICEVVYFIFILYYMFAQGKLMKQQRWAYFTSKWNLLELSIIALSWSALGVFINRAVVANSDMEYYRNHQDQFVSFYDTAAADAVLGYVIAFLVLLSTVKLWRLLRLNSKLNMITTTLKRAWKDISGFIIILVVMFLAYSLASNLLFGWRLYSYRTLHHAAQTIVSLQLGIFNYDEVLDYNPMIGAFIVGSCVIFMTFVVLNLFISVIMVAFSQQRLRHKPSEEEEIADLLLVKLCGLFGMKSKDKKD